MFNKLIKANTKQEIKHLKHKHLRYVGTKALKYLNTLPDKEQNLGARCDLPTKVFMYQHLSPSAVESMNHTNKLACARTEVDVVLSTGLLLKLAATRYQEKKDEAWKWEEALTRYGTKLRDAAFETINFKHYRINIANADNRWECKATREKGHATS
jgi:hypothetical protein